MLHITHRVSVVPHPLSFFSYPLKTDVNKPCAHSLPRSPLHVYRMPARRLLEEEDGDNALYTDFDVGEGRAGQGQSSSSVGSNTLKDAIAFVPPILMIAASQVLIGPVHLQLS